MSESLPEPPVSLAYEEVSLQFVEVIPGKPERGFVPYYHFRIIADGGVDVGHINFRVGATEHVWLCAGHIGYQIQEPYRGHRYALKACHAVAPFVRSIYNSVIITSDPDNTPSLRTIELLGATFIDEIQVPPYDPHYLRGSRTKKRYQWKP